MDKILEVINWLSLNDCTESSLPSFFCHLIVLCGFFRDKNSFSAPINTFAFIFHLCILWSKFFLIVMFDFFFRFHFIKFCLCFIKHIVYKTIHCMYVPYTVLQFWTDLHEFRRTWMACILEHSNIKFQSCVLWWKLFFSMCNVWCHLLIFCPCFMKHIL